MKPNPHIQFAVLELTYHCNLFCPGCYVSASNKFKSPELRNIIPILSTLNSLDVENVLLCGGEPTTHPQFREIVEECKKYNFSICLSTNGVFNTNMAEFIGRSFRELDISLRSINEKDFSTMAGKNGAYHLMLSNMILLSQLGLKININYDLNMLNFQDVYDSMVLLKNNNVRINKVWLQRHSATGRGKDAVPLKLGHLSLDNYINVLNQANRIEKDLKIKCRFLDPIPLCLVPKQFHKMILSDSFGFDWIIINPDGRVRIFAMDTNEDICSILDTQFKSIWETDPSLLEYRSLEWIQDPNCIRCKFLSRCKSGFITSSPNAKYDYLLAENQHYPFIAS